MIITLKI